VGLAAARAASAQVPGAAELLVQKGLDDEYVNGFGQTVRIDKREDLRLAKVKLGFRGWFLDPRLLI
jgi:hypothetical protein